MKYAVGEKPAFIKFRFRSTRGADTIGTRAVGLRIAFGVVPGALRLAIVLESYVFIAEALGVRVEVDVIVVRGEQNAMLAADLH